MRPLLLHRQVYNTGRAFSPVKVQSQPKVLWVGSLSFEKVVVAIIHAHTLWPVNLAFDHDCTASTILQHALHLYFTQTELKVDKRDEYYTYNTCCKQKKKLPPEMLECVSDLECSAITMCNSCLRSQQLFSHHNQTQHTR